MNSSDQYIPFSQRSGFAPIPPQLKLNEVSEQQRILFYYAIEKDIDHALPPSKHFYISGQWHKLAKDIFVEFFNNPPSKFQTPISEIKDFLETSCQKMQFHRLFDFLEYLVRHPLCRFDLRIALGDVLIKTKSPYRLVDERIVAIGSVEQGESVVRAINDTELHGAVASKQHLVAAGVALREGAWADSVRESIHAVEAMARRINSDAKTLGDALNKIEASGYVHGSLKEGFKKLYGYTNDEGGIRHALSDATAKVDEADALFMLGACASFVSYLIARDLTLTTK